MTSPFSRDNAPRPLAQSRIMRWTPIALALTLLATGCMLPPRRVDVRLYEPDTLFGSSFPALPDSAEVELWDGDALSPGIEIAIISSTRVPEQSRETVEGLVEEMKDRARSLGANAITNIRMETVEIRGMVTDPRVPFTAFKQGEFELYFLRGTAFRYTDADGATPES